ncbi:hypothetical protein FQR65_LT06871 [Abscondita terminalis]|nr:hypothetical protein FQR65_LT06871 [Abscondita terminalis]
MFLHIIHFISFATSTMALSEVPLKYRVSWEAIVNPYRSECICEIGLDPALARDFFLRGEYSTTPCVYCYIKCLALKLDLLDAAGKVNEANVVRLIAGTTPLIVAKCNNQTRLEKDICLLSYNMYQCVLTALLIPK